MVVVTNLVEGHLHGGLFFQMPRAANGVNLVNEDDAGALGLGRIKKVSHATRPNPHIHLLEFAAGGIEKRDLEEEEEEEGGGERE